MATKAAPAPAPTATAADDLIVVARRSGLFLFAAAGTVFLAGTRLRPLAWGLLASAFLYVLTQHHGADNIAAWVAQLEQWAGIGRR